VKTRRRELLNVLVELSSTLIFLRVLTCKLSVGSRMREDGGGDGGSGCYSGGWHGDGSGGGGRIRSDHRRWTRATRTPDNRHAGRALTHKIEVSKH
jgi:hypothetical protein